MKRSSSTRTRSAEQSLGLASSSSHSPSQTRRRGGKSIKIDLTRIEDPSEIMQGFSLDQLINPRRRSKGIVHPEEPVIKLKMNSKDNGKGNQGCRYLRKHTDEFPFIKPSSQSEHHVFCEHCRSDISIRSGGRKDIVAHVETSTHERASQIVESVSSSRLLFSAPQSGNMSFEERVSHIVKQSFVGSVLSLCHDVGILQALNNARQPLTSDQIAQTCGLRERYVREALDCLVCAQLIEAGRNGQGVLHYVLPGEAGRAFHSLRIQYLNMLPSQLSNYQRIRECFVNDGPLGFQLDADPIAQRGFERVSDLRVNSDVTVVLTNVPNITERLNAGIDVLEFGCGSGKYLAEFARRFPRSRFVGSEVTEDGVNAAASTCKKLPNLSFRLLDLLDIPSDLKGKYDLVLLNLVIHDLSNPVHGLRGCRNVLKKDGYLVVIDVDASKDVIVNRAQDPEVAIQYAFSTFHCIPQTYSGPDGVQPLGCCWGKDTAIDMAKIAGFNIVEVVSKHNLHFHVMICQP